MIEQLRTIRLKSTKYDLNTLNPLKPLFYIYDGESQIPFNYNSNWNERFCYSRYLQLLSLIDPPKYIKLQFLSLINPPKYAILQWMSLIAPKSMTHCDCRIWLIPQCMLYFKDWVCLIPQGMPYCNGWVCLIPQGMPYCYCWVFNLPYYATISRFVECRDAIPIFIVM